MSKRLKKEVDFQLGELRRLIEMYGEVLGAERRADPGDLVVISIAAILQSFYNGIEGIFSRIVKRIDESQPNGKDFHARLLDKMTRKTNHRPAVITESLAHTLKSYMDFRHMFRHAYANYLVWERIEPLARECKETFFKFEREILDFMNKIDLTDD